MATIEQLATALRNADAAGDTEAATKLAVALKQARTATGGPDFGEAAPEIDRPGLQAALDNRVTDYNAGKTGLPKAGFGDRFNDAVTLGLSKDAAALAHAVGGKIRSAFGGPQTDFWKDYGEGRDVQRARLSQYGRNNPKSAMTADVLGTVGNIAATAPARALATPMTTGQMVRQGAAGGGAFGALAGSDTEQNDLTSRATGATAGAITGTLMGAGAPLLGRAIGRGLSRPATDRAILRGAPTARAVHDASQALYRAAGNEGIVVHPNTFQSMVQTIALAGQRAGADPQVTPLAWGALQRLQREAASGQPITLETLDTLRKVVGASLPEGSAASSAMFGRLTDLMDNLRPGDVIARNPARATQILRDARGLWSRYAKTRTIEAAMHNAENAASGQANGLRNEFRKLLRINPDTGRPLHNWSREERAAIERVVNGTTTSNMLRFFGTFGIPIDQGRNWLGALGGGASGAAMFGPVGAVALPAAGTAAKYAERAATTRAANIASALAARGGVPANAPRLADPAARLALPVSRALIPATVPLLRDRILPAR